MSCFTSNEWLIQVKGCLGLESTLLLEILLVYFMHNMDKYERIIAWNSLFSEVSPFQRLRIHPCKVTLAILFSISIPLSTISLIFFFWYSREKITFNALSSNFTCLIFCIFSFSWYMLIIAFFSITNCLVGHFSSMLTISVKRCTNPDHTKNFKISSHCRSIKNMIQGWILINIGKYFKNKRTGRKVPSKSFCK